MTEGCLGWRMTKALGNIGVLRAAGPEASCAYSLTFFPGLGSLQHDCHRRPSEQGCCVSRLAFAGVKEALVDNDEITEKVSINQIFRQCSTEEGTQSFPNMAASPYMRGPRGSDVRCRLWPFGTRALLLTSRRALCLRAALSDTLAMLLQGFSPAVGHLSAVRHSSLVTKRTPCLVPLSRKH